MPSTHQPTSAQKAAIVIAVLGPDAARPIVDKLDNAALAKVADALAEIPFLPRDRLRDVVIDFLENLQQAEGSLRGGATRAREIIGSLVDAARLDAILGRQDPDADDAGLSVWKRLESRDAKKVAAYLQRLSPNLIAIVLQRLSVEKASDIARQIDDEKLRPTFSHMLSGKKLEPGIESVIQRMIEVEFLNNSTSNESDSTSHLEAIGELLSLIPGGKRETLVDFLRAHFEEQLFVIEKGLFTIEGLPDMLEPSSVPVLFRELGQPRMAEVLAALGAGFEDVSNFLLGNISSRMADQIREEVAARPKLDADTAGDVQREFLGQLMALKRAEAIIVKRPTKAA